MGDLKARCGLSDSRPEPRTLKESVRLFGALEQEVAFVPADWQGEADDAVLAAPVQRLPFAQDADGESALRYTA